VSTDGPQASPEALAEAASRMAALDRYERRARRLAEQARIRMSEGDGSVG
jgi:hypothetical protein